MPARRRRSRPRDRVRAIVAFAAVALAIACGLGSFFAVAPVDVASSSPSLERSESLPRGPARARALDIENEHADRSDDSTAKIARLVARGKAPPAGTSGADLCALSTEGGLTTSERQVASDAAHRHAPNTPIFPVGSGERGRPRARAPPSTC